MRSQKETFARIARALDRASVSIDRIMWLDAIGDEDDGAREYLEDEILSESEERIKEVFRGRHNADGVTPLTVEEIINHGGWIVQASHRAPDPDHVFFENGKPIGWWAAPGLYFHFFHLADLGVALCRALAWARQTDKEAFKKAIGKVSRPKPTIRKE